MEVDLSEFQWDVISLRLTAFPKPGSEAISGWWQQVLDDIPEQQTVNPRSGEFLEVGKYGSGLVELRVNPVNINWSYRIEEQQQDVLRVSLGDFKSTSQKFCSLMDKWFDLDAVSNPVRLAFGAVLIQSVQNQDEGIARLSKYVHSVNFDPPPSSGFLYQLNRRRDSRLDIEGLIINRVMKWSLGQQQIMVNHPDGRVEFAQTPPNSLVHLEVDINTIPEFEGEFQRNILPNIFEELVDLGAEIAEKGDVP
ncbi:MAG: hypothetical protein OXH77_11675 [Anaerolineaceae bacterium]|nr:hypothetical protein [Anaerolineaceae bacterium]